MKKLLIILLLMVSVKTTLAFKAEMIGASMGYEAWAVDVDEDGNWDYEIWQWFDGTRVSWDWCFGPYSRYRCQFAKTINGESSIITDSKQVNYTYNQNVLIIENYKEIEKYKIIDLNGKVIKENELRSNEIDISLLGSGIYVVHLIGGDIDFLIDLKIIK